MAFRKLLPLECPQPPQNALARYRYRCAGSLVQKEPESELGWVDHNLEGLRSASVFEPYRQTPARRGRRRTGFLLHTVQSANLRVERSFPMAIACKVGEKPGDGNDSVIWLHS